MRIDGGRGGRDLQSRRLGEEQKLVIARKTQEAGLRGQEPPFSLRIGDWSEFQNFGRQEEGKQAIENLIEKRRTVTAVCGRRVFSLVLGYRKSI